jgi:tetratricopeptide (TPR) repeat protein
LPYSRATEEIALCLSEMAQRFMDLNMTAQGRRIYEQLLEFPHGNVDVHMKVADFFLAEGLASQVLERLITLLQKLKDSDILFKTGDILLDIQKRYLSSGTTSEKSGVDLSFFKSIGSDEVLSMAEKMFKQGLLLEPDSLRFSLGLARCCIRQNEAKAAADILDRLHEMYAEDVQAFQEVIEALLTEGAYDPAAEWIKSAINRFPREISFYVLYARYYNEQKRYYDAIGCLKRALTLEPSHAGCIVSLAGLYEEIKEYSDAIVYYERAIKLLPRDPTLQEKLRKILNLKFK